MSQKKIKSNDGPLRRVFLVDDHPMLLDGLVMLVGQIPRCMVCGQAATAAEALAGIPAALPDLVIMDLSLPDKNGIELIKEVLAIAPEIRIIAFSMHDEMIYGARAIEAGAMGYLMKGSDMTLLVAAVNQVLDGDIYLSPRISNYLSRNQSGEASP